LNLQPLFRSPILDQQYLDRDYSGFGNDVWIVRTAEERVVVRVSARKGAGGPFWSGVARLFGVDSTSMEGLRAINDAVSEITGFRAPRVLRSGTIDGRAYAITDVLSGSHTESFDALSPAQAEAFGRALAKAHQPAFDFCGSPTGSLRYPLAEFHVRAADTIEWLAHEYHAKNARDMTIAMHAAETLRALPPAASSSLVLYDIGGSQYLWDDAGPSGVVDTECYVYAPRHLELIELECDNGRAFCDAFRRGYETVAPLPDLIPYREAYRCLIAITETNGKMPLADALAAPVWF
jgi:aminoglycoside phosphotransferase (APT) family kinase protein